MCMLACIIFFLCLEAGHVLERPRYGGRGKTRPSRVGTYAQKTLNKDYYVASRLKCAFLVLLLGQLE